jgi:hypothetical protein
MKKVNNGDRIKIGRKVYVFTAISALLFNDALKIRREEGRWPMGGIVLQRFTGSEKPYKIQDPFSFKEVAKAVEKSQEKG